MDGSLARTEPSGLERESSHTLQEASELVPMLGRTRDDHLEAAMRRPVADSTEEFERALRVARDLRRLADSLDGVRTEGRRALAEILEQHDARVSESETVELKSPYGSTERASYGVAVRG